MSIRARIKAAYPRISERELDQVLEARRQTGVVRWTENAVGQALSRRIAEAYPEAVARFYQKGDTVGHSVYRALQAISNPARTGEVAKMLGGTGNESRADVEAYVARSLGFEVGAFRRDILGPIQAADVHDHLNVRMLQQEIEQRIGSGKEDMAVPEISAEAKRRASDDADRENQIRAALYQQLGKASPMEREKAQAYKAGNDLEVDIARAIAAHSGREPNLDVESPGVERWAKAAGLDREHAEMVVNKRVAESEAIKGQVEEQRGRSNLIDSGRTRSAEGADAAAQGVPMEDVRAVEANYLPEGE